MARETKAGLLMIGVLIAGFSLLLYKRSFPRPGESLPETAQQAVADAEAEVAAMTATTSPPKTERTPDTSPPTDRTPTVTSSSRSAVASVEQWPQDNNDDPFAEPPAPQISIATRVADQSTADRLAADDSLTSDTTTPSRDLVEDDDVFAENSAPTTPASGSAAAVTIRGDDDPFADLESSPTSAASLATSRSTAVVMEDRESMSAEPDRPVVDSLPLRQELGLADSAQLPELDEIDNELEMATGNSSASSTSPEPAPPSLSPAVEDLPQFSQRLESTVDVESESDPFGSPVEVEDDSPAARVRGSIPERVAASQSEPEPLSAPELSLDDFSGPSIGPTIEVDESPASNERRSAPFVITDLDSEDPLVELSPDRRIEPDDTVPPRQKPVVADTRDPIGAVPPKSVVPVTEPATSITRSFTGTVNRLKAAPVTDVIDDFPEPQPKAAKPNSLQAAPARVPLAVADRAEAREHVVAAQESLWSIARSEYGAGRYFLALAKHNEHLVPDPRKLKLGMKLEIPPREFLEQHYAGLIPAAPAAAATPPATAPPVATAASGPAGTPVAATPAAAKGDFAAETTIPQRANSAKSRTASALPSEFPPLATTTEPSPSASPVAIDPFAPTGETGAASTGPNAIGFFVGEDGQPLYRVAEGDSLPQIAKKYLGRSSRWVQIYELNRSQLENGEMLAAGTVLRLPADAQAVQVAGGEEPRR